MALDRKAASIPFLWNSLPDILLANVMDFINTEEAYIILGICMTPERQQDLSALRSYWQRIPWNTGVDYKFANELWKNHVVSRFCGIHTLDLGSCASDEMMVIMAELDEKSNNNMYLPLLKTIRMQHSSELLTDSGLLTLAQGKQRRKHLTHIDITWCNKTTYRASLRLRDQLPNLQVLRRIPEWMEGSLTTDCEGDGEDVYYADGSFRFQRNALSKGFVHKLVMWDHPVETPGHVAQVGRTLQFIDPGTFLEDSFGLAAHESLDLARFYRPGASLLRLDSAYNTEDGYPTLLVVQAPRGTFPPSGQFFREVVPTLNLHELLTGVSLYIDRHNGTKVRTERPEGRHNFLSVRRVRKAPLVRSMPPPDLIQEIRAWFEYEDRFSRTGLIVDMSDEEAERFVHGSVARGDHRDAFIFQTAAFLMSPSIVDHFY